jgi:hypothetical protein
MIKTASEPSIPEAAETMIASKRSAGSEVVPALPAQVPSELVVFQGRARAVESA